MRQTCLIIMTTQTFRRAPQRSAFINAHPNFIHRFTRARVCSKTHHVDEVLEGDRVRRGGARLLQEHFSLAGVDALSELRLIECM